MDAVPPQDCLGVVDGLKVERKGERYCHTYTLSRTMSWAWQPRNRQAHRPLSIGTKLSMATERELLQLRPPHHRCVVIRCDNET